MSNSNLIFFDVCDTLYHENTTFDFLEFYFNSGIKAQILKTRHLFITKVLNHLSQKIFDYDFIRSYGIFTLKDESLYNLQIAAELYVKSMLSDKKNEEVHTLLKHYQAEGKKIVLLSGSLDFIIKEVAKSLDVSTYYASSLNIENGTIIGSIENDLLENKQSIIETYYTDIPYIVVTDNLSDYSIVKNATTSYILTKKRHKDFWNSLKNVQILKIIS